MKIISIVGARPQFIKLAPLMRAISADHHSYAETLEHSIIHTGQHYDVSMSEIFFKELEIPNPDFNLFVGSGMHGYQTGRMLIELEELLLELMPDIVVVFGDTNSTLAGALAASKIHIPVAHIEAGLRSYNSDMPEENNRILTDHLSKILFAPTQNAVENLGKESLADRAILSGDIMLDSILYNKELAKSKSRIIDELKVTPKEYMVITIHRAENTDNPAIFSNLLQTMNEVASKDCPVIFPMHPRAKKYMSAQNWTPNSYLNIVPPLGPLDMIELVSNAKYVLTDSGGLQKEAFFLSCPCITLRNETEWIETVWSNSNIITGTDKEKILSAITDWNNLLAGKEIDYTSNVTKYFGNGRTAELILDSLIDFYKTNRLKRVTENLFV